MMTIPQIPWPGPLKSRFLRKAILNAILLIFVVVVLLTVPFRAILRDRAIVFFEQQGVTVESMNIDTLSPSGVEISAINITAPRPMQIGMLRINFFTQRLEVERLILPKAVENTDLVLDGHATMGLADGMVTLACAVEGSPNDLLANFTIYSSKRMPEKNRIVIESAAIKWQGSKLSTRDVTLYTTSDKPVPFVLDVAGAPLSLLVQTVFSPEAAATGTLDGKVAMQYEKGSLKIRSINATAPKPGIIQLPPHAIPGESEQLNLVNQALSDFHYVKLSLGPESAQVPLKLALEGNNPAIQNGQPIKLNVNLGGNVLDMLNTYLYILQQPREFIANEKR